MWRAFSPLCLWLESAVWVALLSVGGLQPAVAAGDAKPWGTATFWHPIPYTKTREPDADEAAPEPLQARQRRLEAVEEELQRREVTLIEREQNALRQIAHFEDWWTDLERRERVLKCERFAFLEGWAEQETSLLHLIVFRLVRIQAAAVQDEGAHAPGAVLVSSGQGDTVVVSSPHAQGVKQPEHERWAKVQIVACLRGSLKAVAGEIPVYSILRASTPLAVQDVCRNSDGDKVGTMELLTLLTRYFQEERSRQGATPTLYYVVANGVNLFFNDMLEVQSGNGLPSEPLMSAEFIRRYEAAVADRAGQWPPPAVVAMERACRRSAISPCTVEEAQHAPYVHANGLAGSVETLEQVFGAMVVLAEEQQRVDPGAKLEDPTVYLRLVAQQWSSLIVPDVEQQLFGSLLEAEQGPCTEAATPAMPRGDGSEGVAWCGPEPCCPLSGRFERLHEAYWSFFRAEGCALRPVSSEQLPLLWHGDGLAKWTYALAMHDLAATCPYIARLVLGAHPSTLLEDLFDRFEATQAPGAVAKRPTGDKA